MSQKRNNRRQRRKNQPLANYLKKHNWYGNPVVSVTANAWNDHLIGLFEPHETFDTHEARFYGERGELQAIITATKPNWFEYDFKHITVFNGYTKTEALRRLIIATSV